MEICRITDQKRPLEEFYRGLAALGPDNAFAKIGARMLDLLQHLREIDGPAVWAVTSHASLNLLAGDDYRLPTLVRVNSDGQCFVIEYRMPANEAPWPDAYVHGRTLDVVRAGDMIVFGLRKAGSRP